MPYQQLVEEHHRLTYRDNVVMVAQQLQNPLRSAVTIVDGRGEAMNVAQLFGKKDARRAPDRDRKNPDNPTPRGARWLMRPEAIEDGEYLDNATKWDTAMDASSILFRNNVASVERGIFDAILGVTRRSDGSFATGSSGIMGNTLSGKRGGTSNALPNDQVIAHGGTRLTLDKLRQAKKIINKNDFGLEQDDPLHALLTPEQVDDLIGIAAAAGSAINLLDVEQLKNGKPTPLLGITWIVSNRVPTDASSKRLIPVWAKKNVVAAFWQDLQGDIWNDTSAKNLPYMYASAVVDATRIEDGGFVIIECGES